MKKLVSMLLTVAMAATLLIGCGNDDNTLIVGFDAEFPPYVYKDADGKRELVNVTIGISDGIHVEIVEGLEEGDVIYVQE